MSASIRRVLRYIFEKYPDVIGVWSAWAHYTSRYASVRPTEKVYHYHCVTTDRTLSGLTARDRCLGPLSPYRIGSSVAAQLTLATYRQTDEPSSTLHAHWRRQGRGQGAQPP